MAKVSRDLSTKENRDFWIRVEKASAIVESWPSWKSGIPEGQAMSEVQLLVLRKSSLKGCILAAKEECERKTDEFERKKEELEAKKRKALIELKSEIKAYHKEIKNIEKRIAKKRKKSGPESPTEMASRVVANWRPEKRAAFEQRTGLKLPKK